MLTAAKIWRQLTLVSKFGGEFFRPSSGSAGTGQKDADVQPWEYAARCASSRPSPAVPDQPMEKINSMKLGEVVGTLERGGSHLAVPFSYVVTEDLLPGDTESAPPRFIDLSTKELRWFEPADKNAELAMFTLEEDWAELTSDAEKVERLCRTPMNRIVVAVTDAAENAVPDVPYRQRSGSTSSLMFAIPVSYRMRDAGRDYYTPVLGITETSTSYRQYQMSHRKTDELHFVGLLDTRPLGADGTLVRPVRKWLFDLLLLSSDNGPYGPPFPIEAYASPWEPFPTSDGHHEYTARAQEPAALLAGKKRTRSGTMGRTTQVEAPASGALPATVPRSAAVGCGAGPSGSGQGTGTQTRSKLPSAQASLKKWESSELVLSTPGDAASCEAPTAPSNTNAHLNPARIMEYQLAYASGNASKLLAWDLDRDSSPPSPLPAPEMAPALRLSFASVLEDVRRVAAAACPSGGSGKPAAKIGGRLPADGKLLTTSSYAGASVPVMTSVATRDTVAEILGAVSRSEWLAVPSLADAAVQRGVAARASADPVMVLATRGVFSGGLVAIGPNLAGVGSILSQPMGIGSHGGRAITAAAFVACLCPCCASERDAASTLYAVEASTSLTTSYSFEVRHEAAADDHEEAAARTGDFLVYYVPSCGRLADVGTGRGQRHGRSSRAVSAAAAACSLIANRRAGAGDAGVGFIQPGCWLPMVVAASASLAESALIAPTLGSCVVDGRCVFGRADRAGFPLAAQLLLSALGYTVQGVDWAAAPEALVKALVKLGVRDPPQPSGNGGDSDSALDVPSSGDTESERESYTEEEEDEDEEDEDEDEDVDEESEEDQEDEGVSGTEDDDDGDDCEGGEDSDSESSE